MSGILSRTTFKVNQLGGFEVPGRGKVAAQSKDNCPISFDPILRIGKRRIIKGFLHMPPLERIWDHRNRTPVLLMSSAIIAVVAVVDWRTNAYVSLGFLYLFPII